MLGQVKESLKKFIGRSTITEDKKEVKRRMSQKKSLPVKRIKNFKKRGRTRSNSKGNEEPVEKKNTNYKGRKNADFKPLKCFKCRCDCVENCQHPCVYHLADKCTKRKSEEVRVKPDLGLFMQHNTESLFFVEAATTGNDRTFPSFIPFEPFTASTTESKTMPEADRNEETVLVLEDMENYTLLANNDLILARGLIDCAACPSTVAWTVWIKNFLKNLSDEWKDVEVYKESQKVYKFGGGETRNSMGSIVFP